MKKLTLTVFKHQTIKIYCDINLINLLYVDVQEKYISSLKLLSSIQTIYAKKKSFFLTLENIKQKVLNCCMSQ